MNKVLGHLKTINTHKLTVMKLCFRIHLYKQGLLHDMSKYTFTELRTGFKYYQDGLRSPNVAEKEEIGYSKAWMHHKGRNKHHFEYWWDIGKDGLTAVEMPKNYVLEMFCDRVAASIVYQKENYTDHHPLMYYQRSREHIFIHPNVDRLLLHLFEYLDKNGLDATLDYIVKEIKE
ncbi:MAG: catalase [Firmicutes bacterium]|nr:catalase [Bacillota bacterium]